MKMVDKDLRKQIKLQDEIDQEVSMGYIPPIDKVKQLKDYEEKTGIIIKNPRYSPELARGIGSPVIDSHCPPGYDFVSSYRKSDGTHVRSFCRKRGVNTEIPERYAYKQRR